MKEGAPGWKVGPLLDRIRRSPVVDRIRRLDFVPDDDLPALYAGADLFLCASHYEGFGFPPLEAMACGTPVISSPGGSLREVLGKAAIVLELTDSGTWCNSIRETLAEGEQRRNLVAAGFAQAARYTWPETARRTWDVYRNVAAS